MNEIDRYIAEFTACLRVGDRDRTRIVSEVRDHLADAIAHREQLGEEPARAVVQALEAFGPAPALATQLNAQAGTRAMRRAPVIAFTAGLTVFGGLLLAGTTQPQPRVPLHAIPATQVSFFAAVVAFEVAVVAGVCAAARALALWRIPTARGADRTYVCRGATISTSALGVAAAGWAVTLGLALNRLPDPNWVSSAVGGFIMIGAAVVAITATQHLRANPFDDADEPSDPRGLFGLTERATGLVQRHPILSCSTVAALSVWPAMAHAETTFIGALPWGLTQAAAVVLAYLVLGPALGLRRPQTA